jgi:hypothetical protein
MKPKTITPAILLFACVLLVPGAAAIFDDWDGTLPRFLPDGNPYGDSSGDYIFPEWNTTPRFDFNDSAYERFSGRLLPDRDAAKSGYFRNSTRPGSGEHIIPGWNGTKPRFSLNDTPFGPFGDRVIPDRNGTKAWVFFNDTPLAPGSGNGMMPGWNGRKPSLFSGDTGEEPQMGTGFPAL